MLPVFVAVKVGTVPATGLLNASFSVIVTVENVDPSAGTGPVPRIDDPPAEIAPAVNMIFPPVTLTGVVIAKIFVSALVEVKVQVEDPVAEVALQAA